MKVMGRSAHGGLLALLCAGTMLLGGGAGATTTSWAVQATPVPTHTNEAQLLGMSCLSAASCTAVGYSINNSGTHLPLIESWNGTAWTVVPAPAPPGASSTLLESVSCMSANGQDRRGPAARRSRLMRLAPRRNSAGAPARPTTCSRQSPDR